MEDQPLLLCPGCGQWHEGGKGAVMDLYGFGVSVCRVCFVGVQETRFERSYRKMVEYVNARHREAGLIPAAPGLVNGDRA